MPRKIYIVGGSDHYANWMGGKIVDKMEDADLVVFTGGEDVTPSLYNRPANTKTFSYYNRDMYELGEFKKAHKLNKHCIGICRGAQFLCVMAGGILVQHQANPLHIHNIRTHDNKEIFVTSTHHQAQYPWGLDNNKYRILGWTVGISNFHLGGDDEEMVNDIVEGDKEVEIAFYPEIKSLCIQAHPEMLFHKMNMHEDITYSITYCRDLLNKHMENQL